MRRAFAPLAAAALLGALAPLAAAAAQSAERSCDPAAARERLALGAEAATARGSLTAASCTLDPDRSHAALYRLELASPRRVELEMQSAAFDAYLVLFDARGARLPDAGVREGRAWKVSGILDAGTYVVAATSFEPGRTGAFTLSARDLAGGAEAKVAKTELPPVPVLKRVADVDRAACEGGATPLAEQDEAEGTLHYGLCGRKEHLYQLTLPEARTVRLTLELEEANVAMGGLSMQILHGEEELASLSILKDKEDEPESRRIALPAGTYRIRLYNGNSFSSSRERESLQYTLGVETQPAVAGLEGVRTPCFVRTAREAVAVGERRRVAPAEAGCRDASGNVRQTYRLVVPAKRRLAFHMDPMRGGPTIEVFDSAGRRVSTDMTASWSTGDDARSAATLEPGTWYVGVSTSAQKPAAGTLLVRAVGGGTTCGAAEARETIAIGQTREERFDPAGCRNDNRYTLQRYRLVVPERQTLALEARSPHLVLSLTLADAEGRPRAYGKDVEGDWGDGDVTRLVRTLMPGTYLVTVAGAYGGPTYPRSGNYSLAVRSAEAGPGVATVGRVETCTADHAQGSLVVGGTARGRFHDETCVMPAGDRGDARAGVHHLTLDEKQRVEIKSSYGAAVAVFPATANDLTRARPLQRSSSSTLNATLDAGAYLVLVESYPGTADAMPYTVSVRPDF